MSKVKEATPVEKKEESKASENFLQFYNFDEKKNYSFNFKVVARREDNTPYLDENGEEIVVNVPVNRFYSKPKDSEHIVFGLGEKRIWVGARSDKLKRCYAFIQQPQEKQEQNVINM